MNCYTPGTRKHTLQVAINANLDRLGVLCEGLEFFGLYEEDPITGEIVLEHLRENATMAKVADEIHNLNAARTLLYREIDDACGGWN